MNKTDSQLQHDVMAELEWDPSLDHADIGVAVHDGVVTLSGSVKTYPEKIAAEAAASRVAGVVALAEEIKVHVPTPVPATDDEIARRIADTLSWNVSIPRDAIKIKVEQGRVTLTGMVDWHYQSTEAESIASRVTGVVGVANGIKVRKMPVAPDVKQRILSAFKRQADLDAAAISVTTEGNTVRLSGKVRAWTERDIVRRAVWAAPGVTHVVDTIRVEA